MNEEWRDIPGYEGSYQVSNLGNVKSLKRLDSIGRQVRERILKPFLDRNGYFMVNLVIENKSITSKIHRLVADVFIENKEDKPQVNHLNGIKTDNKVGNLEWTTRSENMKHAFKIGLCSNAGEKNPSSKLNIEQVAEIRKLIKKYSRKELARKFNVSYSTIVNVVKFNNWL
jgi:hypothetical protein